MEPTEKSTSEWLKGEVERTTPAKSRRQQEIERLVKERRQKKKQWKQASDAERLMLSNFAKGRELDEMVQEERTSKDPVVINTLSSLSKWNSENIKAGIGETPGKRPP